MDWAVYRAADLRTLFADDERALKILEENRITEPYLSTPHDPYRVITKDSMRFMALPACSLWYGSSDEPWFLDLGLDGIEGALYIGTTDFCRLAALVNYTDATNVANIQTELDQMREENARLRTSNAKLRNTLSDVADARSADTQKPAVRSERKSADSGATAA
jgi:hypothetical protein